VSQGTEGLVSEEGERKRGVSFILLGLLWGKSRPCVGLQPNAIIVNVQLGEVVVLVVVIEDLLDLKQALQDCPPANSAERMV